MPHPRSNSISVNSLSLEPAPFAEQAELVSQLGADAIFPEVGQVADLPPSVVKAALERGNLGLVALTHRAFGFASPQIRRDEVDRLKRSIDIAATVGAPALCLTTGGRGDLSWRKAADQFVDAITICAGHAESAGVSLCIEPTSHLYADASIVHRLADTTRLARRAGLKVGLDLFACWVDADLEEAVTDAAPDIAFLQLSDYVPGDRGLPCRAPLGEGITPIEQVVRLAIAAGFRGPIDIEVIGPRISGSDRHITLAPSIAWLRRITNPGATRS